MIADPLVTLGVLGAVFNALPQVIGTIAALVGTVYYCLLMWEYFRNKQDLRRAIINKRISALEEKELGSET